MNRRFAVLAAACLVVATSASAQAIASRQNGVVLAASGVRPPRPGAAKALTGAEIQAEVVGNTITGVEEGETYVEYLEPDGTIRGVANSGFYTGAWRIDNDQICLHYDENDGDSKGWACDPVTLIDGKIYWSNDVQQGDAPEATLIAGNPRKL